jgi:hypothetical protein
MPQTKTKALKRATPRKSIPDFSHGKYAKTFKSSMSMIRLTIMTTVPGMLDTDQPFRGFIVDYLLREYRQEVLIQIHAGVKKVAHA